MNPLTRLLFAFLTCSCAIPEPDAHPPDEPASDAEFLGPIWNPTDAELLAADYGETPERAYAEALAEAAMSGQLKDPESARYTFGTLERAWYRATGCRTNRFAWRLQFLVNAKNSFGGYTGNRPYEFFMRGNEIVAIGGVSNGVYTINEVGVVGSQGGSAPGLVAASGPAGI